MEMFKTKHLKSKSWLVYLFVYLNSPILIAQFSIIKREGVISATKGLEKISVTYKNDTVCGNYFYYRNNILIRTVFLDNRNATYISENDFNKILHFQKADSKDGIEIIYCRFNQFKDTFEMLLYDIDNSLRIGWHYEYYSSGKISGKVNYELSTDKRSKNAIYRLKDSSIWYYESGQIKDVTVRSENHEIENDYYKNGLLESKSFKILKDSKLIYGTHDNYYPNGKLKNTAALSFIDGKKQGIEQKYNERGVLIGVFHYEEGLLKKSLGLDKDGKLKEIKIAH